MNYPESSIQILASFPRHKLKRHLWPMCHGISDAFQVQELMHQDLDVWIDGRHRVRSHEPISEEGAGAPSGGASVLPKREDGYK